MFKYNCLNPISNIGLDFFTADYEKVEDAGQAQALLVRSANVHNMELADSVVAISRAGAGVNNIPLDECAKKGVVVFNTPGANANGVKELVLAGMLLASRDITGGINWVASQQGNEDIAKLTESTKKEFAGTEIKGKKLGVIGLGAIGVLVANAAIQLGMEVYGYDPYLSVNAAWSVKSEIHHVEDVNEIYRQCDFITIHVPLLDSTRGMIDKNAISMLKEEAVILNFARDLLVDEDELLKALAEGKVKRYVTDFPNPKTVGAKGTLVLPHIGASTKESEDNCAIMSVKELMDFMENGNIAHSVNYPMCNLGKAVKGRRIAVCHQNVSSMIGQFTTSLGDLGCNILNMVNKSRGDYAYSLLDLQEDAPSNAIQKLEEIEGVLKVRLI